MGNDRRSLLVTSQLLGPPLLLALQLSTAPIQLHAFRFRDGSGQPKLSLGAKVICCSLVLSPLRLLGVRPSGLRLVVEVWSMLARELATTPKHPLLKDLVVVFAPIYNADGNDKMGPNDQNRRGQIGPEEMGTRHNAMDLDLNRAITKPVDESDLLARLQTLVDVKRQSEALNP